MRRRHYCQCHCSDRPKFGVRSRAVSTRAPDDSSHSASLLSRRRSGKQTRALKHRGPARERTYAPLCAVAAKTATALLADFISRPTPRRATERACSRSLGNGTERRRSRPPDGGRPRAPFETAGRTSARPSGFGRRAARSPPAAVCPSVRLPVRLFVCPGRCTLNWSLVSAVGGNWNFHRLTRCCAADCTNRDRS